MNCTFKSCCLHGLYFFAFAVTKSWIVHSLIRVAHLQNHSSSCALVALFFNSVFYNVDLIRFNVDQFEKTGDSSSCVWWKDQRVYKPRASLTQRTFLEYSSHSLPPIPKNIPTTFFSLSSLQYIPMHDKIKPSQKDPIFFEMSVIFEKVSQKGTWTL